MNFRDTITAVLASVVQAGTFTILAPARIEIVLLSILPKMSVILTSVTRTSREIDFNSSLSYYYCNLNFGYWNLR